MDDRQERYIVEQRKSSSPKASSYIRSSTEKQRGPITAYRPKFIKKILDDIEVRPVIIPPNFTH